MPGLDNFSDLLEAIPAVESIQLQQFIREQWLPSLNRTPDNERFNLDARSKCLLAARAYVNQWGLPEIYLDNFAERLEGMGYLPPLILQNPSKQEGLTYNEMFTKVPTFILLRDILKAIPLDPRHIPMLNVLPFITEDWLDSLSAEDRDKALRGSLDLTILIFKSYRLKTIISCQCLSQRAPNWLEPVVDHPLVKALSSTVRGAVSQTVRRASFAGDTINVIQGFHPSYVLREQNQQYRNDRLQILTSVLTETYRPCQKWAKQNIESDLRDTVYQLQAKASAMLVLISKYQTLESRLHNLSEDSALWYNDKQGTNQPPRKSFSIHTWTEAMRIFLSLLPSQSIDLEIRKYDETTKSLNATPTKGD